MPGAERISAILVVSEVSEALSDLPLAEEMQTAEPVMPRSAAVLPRY